MKFVKSKINPTRYCNTVQPFASKLIARKQYWLPSGLLQILHRAWPVLALLNIRTSCGQLSWSLFDWFLNIFFSFYLSLLCDCFFTPFLFLSLVVHLSHTLQKFILTAFSWRHIYFASCFIIIYEAFIFVYLREFQLFVCSVPIYFST